MLLSLVAEVARELPDMAFLFNTGDQPFVDKVYWSPIPHFHWVRSAGHWTIPLPNPYHLKAYVRNFLGDAKTGHEKYHVPWADKMPKAFWRGSLSAPDNFLPEDMQTLPRIRVALQKSELIQHNGVCLCIIIQQIHMASPNPFLILFTVISVIIIKTQL